MDQGKDWKGWPERNGGLHTGLLHDFKACLGYIVDWLHKIWRGVGM